MVPEEAPTEYSTLHTEQVPSSPLPDPEDTLESLGWEDVCWD